MTIPASTVLLVTNLVLAGHEHQESSAVAELARLRPAFPCSGSRYLAAAPDVNGDGVEEVLLGAPSRDRGVVGRAELLSGQDGESLFSWAEQEHGGEWGAAVAAWGDSEGRVHLAIGEPGAANGRGRVGLVVGADLESVRWIDGAEGQTCFGFALGAGRDATGDGSGDLAVVAPDVDGGGAVALVDGSTGEVRWRAYAETEGGIFGYDVALTPDLDGDGLADVLVGHLGAGASVLSGADGTPLFKLGDLALGRRIGDSVAVLERRSAGPLLVLGSGGVPEHDDFAEDGEADLPDPGIFVFDAETRRRSVDTSFAIPGHPLHRTTVGMRVRATGDFDGDGHEDLAVCQPNGYLIYGGSGRLDLRSGASDTKLGSTYYGGVRLPVPAWQFGTDACSILREGKRVLVIACPSDGGVVAAEAGPEIGANQGRDHYLPVVWVRLDP